MKKKAVIRKTVTPHEAAAIYGLSVGTLANMRVRKTGSPYYVCGRKVFYRVEDLERWLFANPILTMDSLPEDKKRG